MIFHFLFTRKKSTKLVIISVASLSPSLRTSVKNIATFKAVVNVTTGFTL